MTLPTGSQYSLQFSDTTATITQVAAGIRVFQKNGIDLTEPFPATMSPPSADGIVLVPWPNRVKDGRWDLAGVPQQLALTEPRFQNASHGLLRYRPYELVEHSESSVTQRALIFPEPGYPFTLETTVTHSLGDTGLTVTHQITNRGESDAPVAIGAHPYLRMGDTPPERLSLTSPTQTRFLTDERNNVIGELPVAGTEYDLSGGVRLSELESDRGFSVPAGAEHVLASDSGQSLSLWGDESFGYVQVFTHRSFATRSTGSPALAVEPMSAPSNALNTGRGIRWLAPGEVWIARWGIRPEL